MFRFPWGDFHSLNLGWFLEKFNELSEDWATAEAGIDGALDAEIQKAEDALTDVFAARDAAAASASAAGQSATAAGNSATQAGNSASAAAGSATAAAGSATAAGQSETAAGNSATAASNSAGAAATSATQAGQSATAAGNSATAAGQSATNAAASETAAGNSAAAAAASETAAGNSASDAEDAAASIEASAQQIATNASDIVNLKSSINNKAPIIINNASGAIVHFTDGADNIPVKALTVEGAESATVTRTGKNLLDPSTRTTAATNIQYYTQTGLRLVAGTYTVSIREQVQGIYVIDKNSGTIISQKYNATFLVFTLAEDKIVRFDFYSSTGISSDIFCQLEIGASATTYEPYKSNTFLYPSESVTTFYGVNNIWSDVGNVNVAYYTDTKLYIDNKIAELQATVLENIGG